MPWKQFLTGGVSDAAFLVCWDKNLQHDKGYGPIGRDSTKTGSMMRRGSRLGCAWTKNYIPG
jgi:hypothetical protein